MDKALKIKELLDDYQVDKAVTDYVVKQFEELQDEYAIKYFRKMEQLQKAQAKTRYSNYEKIAFENLELAEQNTKLLEKWETIRQAYEGIKKAL